MPPNVRKPRVHVAPSPIHGRGLFASEPIARGQLIGRYTGSVVESDGPYVLWVENDAGDGWTGYDGRNELRFLNHSDQPNAEMDGLHCYSLTHIAAGTEITIDYGWNDA